MRFKTFPETSTADPIANTNEFRAVCKSESVTAALIASTENLSSVPFFIFFSAFSLRSNQK
jgi:hypothetical protein